MLSKYKTALLIVSVLIILVGVSFGVAQNYSSQNNTGSKSVTSNALSGLTRNEKLSNVHKSPKNIVAYDLNNYESINCDKYQIQPYSSLSCDLVFKNDFPKENLGSIMIHFVDVKNSDNTAMLGCVYKIQDNQKNLLCENDIMFVQKGEYIPELSLSDQIKKNISTKNLIVDGEPAPYQINETVDIS